MATKCLISRCGEKACAKERNTKYTSMPWIYGSKVGGV